MIHKRSDINILRHWATKILDAEYKAASVGDVIKTCENLHAEEQHQLKILLQNLTFL
jgi:hypothetical protein